MNNSIMEILQKKLIIRRISTYLEMRCETSNNLYRVEIRTYP